MKKYLLFAACFFTLTSTLYSQNLQWRVVPSLGSGADVNKVLFQFQVRSSNATRFWLGATNLVAEIPLAARTCIDGTQAVRTGTTGAIITGNAGSYLGGNVSVSGTSSRIGVSIQPNGTLPSGVQVSANPTWDNLATVAVPITNCGCPNFQLTASQAPVVSSATSYVAGLPVLPIDAFSAPGSNVTYDALGAATNVDVTAPDITNLTPAQANWFLCDGVGAAARTITLNAAATTTNGTTVTPAASGYFWRVSSTINSRFVPGNVSVVSNTTSSISLRIGDLGSTPNVTNPTRDTVYVSTVGGSNCTEIQVINVNPSPSVGFTLSPLGPTSIQTGQNVQFRLLGSQLGVDYTLIRYDDAVSLPVDVQTLAGTGGQLTFASINFGAAGTPYFGYRASPGSGSAVASCFRELTRAQSIPVNVVSTTLPAFTLSSAPAGPYCTSGATVTLNHTTAGLPIGSTFTWTSDDPSVTFPNGNISTLLTPSVTAEIGRRTTNTPIVTISCLGQALVSGVIQTRVVTTTLDVRRIGSDITAGPITINGPAFAFFDGISPVVLDYTVSLASPGSNWSLTPATAGMSINSATGQVTISPGAPLSGSYNVRYQDTPLGCGPTTYTFSLTVGDCNANPGSAGPTQTVCLAGSAAVFTTGTPVGTLQWEEGPTVGGPWTAATGIGATGQVYLVSNATASRYYRLRATGTQLGSGLPCTVNSDPILLDVQNVPTPGVLSTASVGVCQAGTAALTLTGASGNVEWQQSPNGVGWVTAAGTATGTTLTTTLLTSTTFYRARVFNGCSEVFTNVVSVSVGQPPDPFANAPAFVFPGAVCEGSDTDIDVVIDEANGETGLFTTSSSTPGSSFAEVFGPFTPALTPGASKRFRYTTATGEATQSPVTLTWAVTSPGCTPRLQQVNLTVNVGPSGIISTPAGSLVSPQCLGATTNILVASVASGTFGGWQVTPAGAATITEVSARLPGEPQARSIQLTVSSNPIFVGALVNVFYTVSSSGCGVPIVVNRIGSPVGPFAQFAIASSVISGGWTQISGLQSCQGSTITLDGLGAGLNTTGQIFYNTSQGDIRTGNSTFFPTVANGQSFASGTNTTLFFFPSGSFTGNTSISWRLSSITCPNVSTITKVFTISQQPVATITNSSPSNVAAPLSICGGSATSLVVRASFTPTTATGLWTTETVVGLAPDITNPTIFSSNTSANALFTPNASHANTRFNLVWTASLAGTGCSPNSTRIQVNVGGTPSGTFNGSAAAFDPAPLTGPIPLGICAGTSIATSASLDVPAYFTGKWRTADTLGYTAGTGTFTVSGANGENAVYFSQLGDAGREVPIIWEVVSPGCGSVTYVRLVNVLSATVISSWGPGPGFFLPDVCSNANTGQLGASFGGTPTRTVWRTDGDGSFRSALSLAVIDSTSPNAIYVPGPTDQFVNLTWRVEANPCTPVDITRPLFVARLPDGQALANNIVCSPATSDTLKGIRLPSMLGQGFGFWEPVLPAVGSVIFEPSIDSTDRARYLPTVADEGTLVTLRYRLFNFPCAEANYTIQVPVAGASTFSINGPPAGVCAGDTLTLSYTTTGSVAGIFNWIPLGALLFSGPGALPNELRIVTQNNVNISLLAQFPDPVNPNTVPGCSELKTYSIFTVGGSGLTAEGRIISDPNPPQTSLAVCGDTPIEITMTPTIAFDGTPLPIGYLWTFDDGSTIPSVFFINGTTQTDQTINLNLPTRLQPYVFLARARTEPNNCFSFDPITVNVQVGTAPVFASPYTLCQDPTGVNILSPTNLATIVPGSISRTWYTPGGLAMTSYPNINSVPPLEQDTVFVVNEELYVNLSQARDTVAFRYELVTPTCTIPVPVAFSIQSPPSTSFLAFRSGADSVRTLRPFPYPVDLAGSPIINEETTVSLATYAGLVSFRAPSATGVLYTYDFGDPTPQPDTSGLATNLNSNNVTAIPGDSTVRHFYGREGRYTVVLYAVNTINNCADFGTATNFIEIRPPEFFFPTAFTPNGDGNNDVFQALPLEANPLVVSLQVFDRNGQVVYQTGGYTSPVAGQRRSYGWDGTNGTSAKLDPGMYTYRATIEVIPGTNRDFVGTVTLIR